MRNLAIYLALSLCLFASKLAAQESFMSRAKAIAEKIVMDDLYKEVAASMKIKVPADDMKPFALAMDKTVFDPNNPSAYLKVVKK